jgi:phospholipid/cholesterol/gamma-HCH transport system permease protein
VIAVPRFQLQRRGDELDPRELEVQGPLALEELEELWREVRVSAQDTGPSGALRLDLSRSTGMESAHTAALAQLVIELEAAGRSLEIVGLEEGPRRLLELYTRRQSPRGQEQAGGDDVDPEPPSPAPPDGVDRPVEEPWLELWIERLGGRLLAAMQEAHAILSFVGELVTAVATALRAPRTVHGRDVRPLILRTGADAVPIVALINGLVGLIMAFQAAVQLKQVGANIFAADLVGLSVTREFGPLITAVVLAGRSGAAFAAELGSMAVAEELDALRTLGLDPYGMLVIPRLLALLVAVPILSLMADVVGIAGGLVVGVTSLDLTPSAYLLETQRAVGVGDVASGLLKSLAFAVVVAVVACQRGLAARGGAVGVGRSTTSSVVLILLNLIIVDSALTWLFHVLGL